MITLKYIPHALQLWRTGRSQAVLSILGVIVGVAGVVIVVALGDGARKELDAAIGSLGAGSVVLRNTAESTADWSLRTASLGRLENLLQSAVKRVAAVRNARLPASSAQAHMDAIRVLATERGYRDIFRLDLYAGRFISDYDGLDQQRICVVSWEAARRLFPNGQVIGQQLKLGDHWHRVVGWLAPSARKLPKIDALNIADLDLAIYVPLPRGAMLGSAGLLDEAIIQFHSESIMTGTLPLLARSLALGGNAEADAIELIVPIDLLRQKQSVQNLFQYFLLGAAALLLGVGGVGIMNTMILNVINRRPEVGLRMAIGATRQQIVLQFVTESMVLAVAGGLLGVALGFIAASLIDMASQWRISYDPSAALLGFAVSITVGMIFGGYPALQAASVSPVDTLSRV